MSYLDNRSTYKQLDKNNYIGHIFEIPEQIVQGYETAQSVTIPALYAQSKQLIILSTGEMLPVAYAIEALMRDYARVPVFITQDFILPKWVAHDTLVLALDYYGDNEQVLTAYNEAAKRKARLLSVSVAGTLARDARRFRAPHVALTYGAPARAAYFYVLSGMAAVLKKLDYSDVKESTMSEAALLCRSLLQTIHPDVPQYKNAAKQLAEKVVTHRTLIIGSGLFVAVAKKWQLDFAATSKVVTTATLVNEFNDTFVNTMQPPAKGMVPLLIIMLQSKYDFLRVKLQQTLIYQIAQSQKTPLEQIFMHPSGSLLSEILLCAAYGMVVSYYAALLTSQDPSSEEATRYIKDQLVQQPTLDPDRKVL